MRLFEDIIKDVRKYVDDIGSNNPIIKKNSVFASGWPSADKGSIVMKADTCVELGSPKDESVSFLLWTNDKTLINDNNITLIGPDLPESRGKSLPFGKIVLLGVNGFDAENSRERHSEIELIRYDLSLKGYMMRAASQYLKEWSRVSADAVNSGFSLFTLAGGLIELYKAKDYIKSAEAIMITSSPEDVKALGAFAETSSGIVAAMNKMAEEMSLDCGTCGYAGVCGEIDGLRAMRDIIKKGS